METACVYLYGIFATWQKCDRISVDRTFAVVLFVGSFAKNAILTKFVYTYIYILYISWFIMNFCGNFTIHEEKLKFC